MEATSGKPMREVEQQGPSSKRPRSTPGSLLDLALAQLQPSMERKPEATPKVVRTQLDPVASPRMPGPPRPHAARGSTARAAHSPRRVQLHQLAACSASAPASTCSSSTKPNTSVQEGSVVGGMKGPQSSAAHRLASQRPATRTASYPAAWQTFQRQREAYDFIDRSPELLRSSLKVFAEEVAEDGRRRFIVTTPERMWEEYQLLQPSERHHYEIIREGCPCHLYFDLEYMRLYNPGLDGDAMVQALMEVVAELFKECFGFVLKREWILELDSSTDAKFSRHVLVKAKRAVFKDNMHVRVFVSRVVDRIRLLGRTQQRFAAFTVLKGPRISVEVREGCDTAHQEAVEGGLPHEDFFVDTSVYSRNRAFRLFLSSKFGKQATLQATARFGCSSITGAAQPAPAAVAGSTPHGDEHAPCRGVQAQAGLLLDPGRAALSDGAPKLLDCDAPSSAAESCAACAPVPAPPAADLGRLPASVSPCDPPGMRAGKSELDEPPAEGLKPLPAQSCSDRWSILCSTATYSPTLDEQPCACVIKTTGKAQEDIFFASLICYNAEWGGIASKGSVKILPFRILKLAEAGAERYQGVNPAQLGPAPLMSGGSSMRHQSPPTLNYGSALVPMLDTFIQSVCCQGGVPGKVRSWSLLVGTSNLLVNIKDNRWCGNIQASHKSNGIYYLIDVEAGTWHQRCFDPCCRSYRSAAMPLPKEVWDFLRGGVEHDVQQQKQSGSLLVAARPPQDAALAVPASMLRGGFVASAASTDGPWGSCSQEEDFLCQALDDFDARNASGMAYNGEPA